MWGFSGSRRKLSKNYFLSWEQNWAESTEFLYTLFPHNPACCTTNIMQHNDNLKWKCVGLYWLIIINQSASFIPRVTQCCAFYEIWKLYTTWGQHCSIVQQSCISPNIFCVFSSFSSFLILATKDLAVSIVFWLLKMSSRGNDKFISWQLKKGF